MSQLSANPWRVDAADVAAAALTISTGFCKLQQIEFFDYPADTDTCLIQDIHGNTIWKGNGAADLETVRSGQIGNVQGVVIPMGGITAGSIVIYFV